MTQTMTAPVRQPDHSFRDQVAGEFRAMQIDLLWTEKAHFATAAIYARLHQSLGILTTVSAAVAAATVVADTAPIVSGSAAVVATITSAVVTFLKAQDTQQKHLTAGRRLGALRVRIRQAHALELHPTLPERPDAWRALASDFAEQKAEIDADAPGTSNWAFRAARRKIEAGHFEHN